jgi:hypothetical protein
LTGFPVVPVFACGMYLSCMRKVRYIHSCAVISGIVAIIAAGCGSPFFPDTGPPLNEQTSRATPEGVVQQLVKSYESRRIDLFEELMYSEQDFRFYVELDLDVSGFTKIMIDRTETVDLNSDYFQDGAYVFLTYSEEKLVHQKMFQQATSIFFDERLEVVSVEYLRSLGGGGSVSDSANAGFAVVRTDNASIRITADIIKQLYNGEAWSFPVGKQVFYLKKDMDGLWRILFWFELA